MIVNDFKIDSDADICCILRLCQKSLGVVITTVKIDSEISQMVWLAVSFVVGAVAVLALWLSNQQNDTLTGHASSEYLGSGVMFDKIAPYYDLANILMSLGLDKSWRHTLVRKVRLSNGMTVMDLATGTGEVIIELAKEYQQFKEFSNIDVIGVDPSVNMLDFARHKTHNSTVFGNTNSLEFHVGSAEQLAFPNHSVDVLTMSFGIRNVHQRAAALSEMHRVMRRNVVVDTTTSADTVQHPPQLYIMEFLQPTEGALAPIAKLFIRRIVPTIGAMLSMGRSAREYAHLRDSIERFPSKQAFLQELNAAGFIGCSAENAFYHVIYIFNCTTSAE